MAASAGQSRGFSFAYLKRLLNRRFAMVAGIAAAAVLVPVIAVSASANAKVARAAGADDIAAARLSVQQGVPLASGAEEESAKAQAAARPEATPTPVPTATPEPEPVYLTLNPDTNHADIIKLQHRLMELYYMDNDEPTDYYGPMTQQAVGYFQRKAGLPIDGVAGPETQEVLFSEGAKPYSVTVGGEGADVSNIQSRLEELGYSVGVTGYFGTDTESAVKYFQRMNGLYDDGSVGMDTKDVLFSEGAEPAENAPKKSSSGSGGGGGGGSTSHVADPGNVEAMIAVALSQQGKPYRTAGKGPDSYDCSGLVYYALRESGNGIGYMTSGGWAGSGHATVGSMGDLRRGDIICFHGHVAIYLGDGTMVDASSSQGCVVVRSCTGSWSVNNFICGKRPL